MAPPTPRIRHEDHEIGAGVRGWLESPLPGAAVDDCVFVSGWAFSTGARIVDVWTEVGGERRPFRARLRRDDVAAAYPSEPAAVDAGFSAYVEFDHAAGVPASLDIHAALEDGRTIRLFTRRVSRARKTQSPIAFVAREVLARPYLLLSPRAWRSALALLGQSGTTASNVQQPALDATTVLEQASRAALTNFLASRARLVLPSASTPVVSVIVIVWNRAELTLGSLRALAVQSDVPLETIVVDNASTDETAAMLAHVDGATVITNAENRGFTVAANIGASHARGEFLLFLNNDAELLPGAMGRMLATARRASVGVVGGKLVFPDGRLQEAGSIVWSDGSCDAYGRGGDPLAPEYTFERPVDFCSGALLLTRRALFADLHGFDERYKPAYYEDADYCVRVWARGYSVVYQPRAVAIHREFGSSPSRSAGIALQRERREIFAARHHEWLARQRSRDGGVLAARSHPHGGRSLIFVDDAAPDPRRGGGFPRAAAMVRAFRDLGYFVTVYTTGAGARQTADALDDVEIVPGGPAWLQSFFAARRGAEAVVVSRPHNMQYVKAAVGADLAGLGAPCVYDAEAVFAVRDIGRRALSSQPASDAEQRTLVDAELALARGCAAVLVVSENERRLFAAATTAPVHVVSHAVDAVPTQTPVDCRRSMLFVGAFGPNSPNDDAVEFFVRDVLPALRARGCDAPLVIAGAHAPDRFNAPARGAGIAIHRDVGDLTALYDDARVFVAPTRFGAGIPLKVIEAAARGVPVVGTTLVARQLGWESGRELLTADTPAEFASAIASLCVDREIWTRVRDAALARVQRDHGTAHLKNVLSEALTVMGRPTR
jgi:GT2 family glycosyltransferase